MPQLILTKVILTLLLSCLVIVTRNHAMLQVHLWVRGHGDKALRLPQQEAMLMQRRMHAHGTMHLLTIVCSQA